MAAALTIVRDSTLEPKPRNRETEWERSP